jgi:hypothetical protein
MGQLGRGHGAARLQQEHHVDQPGRAHRSILLPGDRVRHLSFVGMSTEEARSVVHRIGIFPDPAWDGYEEEDGVFVVELSWPPDPLAGRPPQLVASPELVTVMAAAGLTGYRTGAARGEYGENTFHVEEGVTPPPLVRLIVGDDPAADFSYRQDEGLTVTERTLILLQARCQNLTVEPTT